VTSAARDDEWFGKDAAVAKLAELREHGLAAAEADRWAQAGVPPELLPVAGRLITELPDNVLGLPPEVLISSLTEQCLRVTYAVAVDPPALPSSPALPS
jgi:hypothetical protein